MEEIQFLSYILSIIAVLFAAWSFFSSMKQEEKYTKEIEDLKYRINLLKEHVDGNRKR